MTPSHATHPALLNICHIHPITPGGMTHINRRTVKTNADAIIRLIKLAVIRFGGHQILHRVAGYCFRYQVANQRSGDTRVAIGELVNVRVFHPVLDCDPNSVSPGETIVKRLVSRDGFPPGTHHG